LFVCLSTANKKTRFSQKVSSLEPWSLLMALGSPNGLFKEPIIRPLKFKMAEIRHLENREIAISQRKNHPINRFGAL